MILDIYNLCANKPFQKKFLSAFLLSVLKDVNGPWFYRDFSKKVDVIRIVQQCSQDGIDFSASYGYDYRGWPTTSLLAAISLNDLNLVNTLISIGAPINILVSNLYDYTSATILGVAIQQQNAKMVKTLLEHGADPNMHYGENKGGLPQKINYALFSAIEKLNTKEIIELLIEYKADVNVRNGEGKTPLDFYWERRKNAYWSQQEEIEQILVKAGAKTTMPHKKEHEKEKIVRE